MKSFNRAGSGDVYNTDAYWRMIGDLKDQQVDWMQKQPEGEPGPEAEVVKGLGAEALERVTEEPVGENVEAETPEPELDGAEEAQAREELAAWTEKMAGAPEEYWQQLEKDWWVQSGVPLEYYAQPKVEVLLEKAKEFLKVQVPGLSEAGIEVRAEMATKVALQGLAEKEVEMLQQAKVDRKGERKLKKGWDGDLLHQAYYAMRGDLARIYAGDETERGDDLSESELAAWWVASEPENARAKQELERLQAEVEEPEAPKEPKVEEKEEKIVRLKPEEVEIVHEPAPLVTLDEVVKSEQTGQVPESMIQKLWQALQDRMPFVNQKDKVVTALVPVVARGEIVETGNEVVEKSEQPAEEVDSKEAVGQTIGMLQQAIQALERDAGYLEDYDERKSNLLEMLNELLVLCLNIQVEYETAADGIAEGKQQKALGLELDRTEPGDSATWRKGELALEGLYAEGMLERDQSAEEKMEQLRVLQTQVEAQIRASNELLRKILPAARLLKHEMNGVMPEVEDDKVMEFPSQEALRELNG